LFTTSSLAYTYFDPTSPQSCLLALEDLSSYIGEEGPFDAILAFSAGATLAATYLAQLSSSRQTSLPEPIKLAIFLSGVSPVSLSSLTSGEFRRLSLEEDGEVINIPTAHVYGMRDERFPGSSAVLETLCKREKRAVFVHEGGHPIPAGRRELGEMVKVVRRAIHWGGVKV
jgi:hypothetical protein